MNNLPLSVNASKRVPELDGLRGIAILLVLSFHYINNTLVDSDNRLGRILAKLTSFGWAGVDLFFVLSGFLIGSILIENRASPNFFKTFYFRRLVRIVPNYYLLIVIFLFINLFSGFRNNNFLSNSDNVIPIWSYFAMVHNFFMASFRNLGNDALSVTWSIGIEEQFYIIFPWVVVFLKKKYLPIFLVAAILAAIFFRSMYTHWIPPYVLLACRMDAISFGILIAYFHSDGSLKLIMEKYSGYVLALLLSVIICTILVFAIYQDLGILRNTILSVVFSIALIFALYKKQSLFGRGLRLQWLCWVGKISYSLYLFHYLILGIFSDFAGNKGGVGIYSSKGIFFAGGALLTSIGFAWLVYEKMEKPFVLMGKKFSY